MVVIHRNPWSPLTGNPGRHGPARADDTIVGLMGRMTTEKFRHIPVVAQGKLIGIVSIGDVVKNRVDEIEQESKALRDYIRTA